MKIAIDTECTGNRFYIQKDGENYPDGPYYISACDEDGRRFSWDFLVNPFTREVIVPPDTIEEIHDTLSRYSDFVFHNAKFDLAALSSIGVYPRKFGRVHDTIFRYHLLDNTGSLRLKDLALLHLDILDDDESDLLEAIQQARRIAKKLKWNIVKADRPETDKGHWMKMDGWLPAQLCRAYPELCPELKPVELGPPFPEGTTVHPWTLYLSKYGDKDAERTMALELLAEKAFQERQKAQESTRVVYPAATLDSRYDAQIDVIEPIQTMETLGVSINLERLHSSLDYFQEKVECHRSLMQDILQEPDFNPASSKQLQAALFEEYRLPILKLTKGGGPSTDEDTLLALSSCDKVTLNPDSDQAAFLKELLEFKAAESSRSHLKTYDDFRVGNRLHSSFNATGTNTTRLASSGPNLQNIEKEEEDPDYDTPSGYFIRRVFGPEKGRVWLDFDYDQLQLRIFAYLSGDKRMIAAFEAGWDAHNFMACQVFKTDTPTKLQRRVAKTINFGFIFGAGPDKIERVSGDSTIWPTVQKLFPGAVSYINSTINEVKRNGGVVYPMGYPLKVPNDQRDKPKAYAGVVYKVQGLEGLIVKRAMVGWDKYLKLISEKNKPDTKTDLPFAFLSLQVHDQLIADFKAIPDKFLKFHAKSLRNIMKEAGTYHGVVTPASGAIVRDAWDQAEDLIL